MTLSERDKKIVMVLVPLVLIGAFVFLVMKPKREEAAKAAQALEQQRERRDQAVAREQQLRVAKQSFAADYTTVVRLGKAVPTDVDMPSVLVQLERAARGTRIEFGKITPGARIPASGKAPASGGASPGGGAAPGSSSAQPTAAGGEAAQSAPGQTAEKANNAAAGADQTSATREKASPEADTQTSSSSSSGSVPVGGGAAASGSGEAKGVPGLDTVPLELRFTGDFFDLADFFHDLKRFVRVANDDFKVRGRLMTVDAFSFKSESFPKLEAEMSARIFLAPEDLGTTGGASPTGPGAASGNGTSQAESTSSPTPTTAAAPGVAAP